MADVGTISFHNAHQSGVLFSLLGSGTPQNEFDHIGFFGINGTLSAVEVGSFQDTTFIVDSVGNPLDGIGYAGAIGSSGQLVNNKLISTSGVAISGVGNKLITQVNVFDPDNLTTEPEFSNQGSGTILVRYVASGVSTVNIFNAKMYAYDATGQLTDGPPDVTVQMYEINASGQYNAGASSGLWTQAHSQVTPLLFVNHSQANGWLATNEHLFVAGVSVKPNAIGVLDDFNIAMQLQFA